MFNFVFFQDGSVIIDDFNEKRFDLAKKFFVQKQDFIFGYELKMFGNGVFNN
jgi:hypothetical protein